MLSPLDLERRFGITGGNIFHGEMSLDQMFVMRPVAGWARYRTPIRGLYLCGSGAPPRRRSHGRSGVQLRESHALAEVARTLVSAASRLLSTLFGSYRDHRTNAETSTV